MSLADEIKPGGLAEVGVLEWFFLGDHQRVEETLEGLKRCGVDRLRTGVSWADWHDEGGRAWYRWLMKRLQEEGLEVMPCFLFTPPSLGVEPRASSPPRRPKDYADFIDVFLSENGEGIEYVELWNEANSPSDWDERLDPGWLIFCEMVGGAAYWCKQLGYQVVLGGMCPIDPPWLEVIAKNGVLEYIDIVGVHGFPGTWAVDWTDWPDQIGRVQAVLDRYESAAKIWITETGYSTIRQDQFQQIQVFVDALKAPVERVYWYGWHDLPEDRPSIKGFHIDEREYHLGLVDADGEEKLLTRLWRRRGVEGVLEVASWKREPGEGDQKPKVLITGGAGFVGANLAASLMAKGEVVTIYDNLSRDGVEKNLEWLRERFPERFYFIPADLRDHFSLRQALDGVEEVYHLAGQVAVTTSLERPQMDFEVNGKGTLILLEEMRRLKRPPRLVFTSTNKVYGNLAEIELQEGATRYEPREEELRSRGIDEAQPLQLYSPYGCSKGVADQYVLDYARHFGLHAVVMRMSCIYGPRQFGTEDQGWVAHFMLQALRDGPIRIYGDGKQVRDVLFINDLVQALMVAMEQADKLRGGVFNIGGGPQSSLSLRELLERIEEVMRRPLDISFSDWRAGDQKYFIADTTSFEEATGWRRTTEVGEGLELLYDWLSTLVTPGGAHG